MVNGVMLSGSIASLKVTFTVLLSGTAVAPQEGLFNITVGGVVSAAEPVVNVQLKATASGLPARSLAPVLTFTVNRVLAASALVGENVATLPIPAYATEPGTGVVPGPVTVNVVPVIVSGSICSLKFTATLVLSATPVAPQVGIVESTVGAVVSGASPVVNPHEKVVGSAVPPALFTPVVTVTVIEVLAGRAAVDANVAILLAAA
jgi:hypothetical protein